MIPLTAAKPRSAALCPDRDVDRPWAEKAAFKHPTGPERGGKGRVARGETRLNQLVSDSLTPERLRPARQSSCSTIRKPADPRRSRPRRSLQVIVPLTGTSPGAVAVPKAK